MTNTVGRHLPWLFVGLLGAGAFAAVATARGEPVAPTVQEGGVPGYDVSCWVCVLGLPALPRPLAERIHAALEWVYADPALQERFRVLGLQADLRGPAQLAEFLKADDAAWAAGQIVKAQ